MGCCGRQFVVVRWFFVGRARSVFRPVRSALVHFFLQTSTAYSRPVSAPTSPGPRDQTRRARGIGCSNACTPRIFTRRQRRRHLYAKPHTSRRASDKLRQCRNAPRAKVAIGSLRHCRTLKLTLALTSVLTSLALTLALALALAPMLELTLTLELTLALTLALTWRRR